MSIIKLSCPSCGGNVSFGENDNIISCEYCGTVLQIQQEVEKLQKDHQAEIDALTDRIYDLIAQKQYVQAQNAANEGLLTMPYAGRLHLCLLLCELNLDNPEKLGACGKNYTTSQNFHNCVRYMTEEDKKDLLSLAQKNTSTVVIGPSTTTTSPQHAESQSTAPQVEQSHSDDTKQWAAAAMRELEEQKQRISQIMQMNLPLISKLRQIAYNPVSNVSIVDYMLEYGPYLEHIADADSLVDDRGNCFIDFVDSDNNFAFGALAENIDKVTSADINGDPKNQRFVDDVKQAVEMWGMLNELTIANGLDDEYEFDQLVELYNNGIEHINLCAQYTRKVFAHQPNIKETVDDYINEQTIYWQNHFNDCLSQPVLARLQSVVLGQQPKTSKRLPTASNTVDKSTTTTRHSQNSQPSQSETPTKLQHKLKLGVIFAAASTLVLGISLIIAALFMGAVGEIIFLLIGGFVTIFGVAFLVALPIMHKREIKERTCSNCGTLYDYDSDISYEVLNEDYKKYKYDPSNSKKQVLETLTYTFQVDCECHKCQTQKTYTKKLNGGTAYSDGTTKITNPSQTMRNYYKQKSISGTTKKAGTIGWIVTAVLLVISLVLLIAVPTSAADGGTGKLPSKYYGTYYGIYNESIVSFEFNKKQCAFTLDSGLVTTNEVCEYEYAKAEKAQTLSPNEEFEGYPAVIVHYSGNKVFVLWLIDDSNGTFAVKDGDGGYFYLSPQEQTFADYMNDPCDYYKTYENVDNNMTISLHNDGTAEASFIANGATIPYQYVTKAWLQANLNSATLYDKAIVLYNAQTEGYYVVEYVNANLLRINNIELQSTSSTGDNNPDTGNNNPDTGNNNPGTGNNNPGTGEDVTDTENLTFQLSSDNSYYIVTGCSEKNLTQIVIPDTYNGKPVKEIAEAAFLRETTLTSVTIPASVTIIGDEAFARCTNLTTVNFAGTSQLTTIGLLAFSRCESLTSLAIPDSVIHIDDDAFRSCTSLKSVTLPENVTYIGRNIFGECASLETVYWNATNCVFGGITEDSVYPTFYDCNNLTRVVIGANVQVIYDYLFAFCENLTVVDFENGSQLATIGYAAFCNCTSLVSITIPENVTYIGDYAFYNCTSLEVVDFENSSQLATIGEGTFEYCISLVSITIPKNVTYIGDYAFDDCTSLEVVDFENGSQLATIGVAAFWDCTSLVSITIPDSVITIELGAFLGCTNLTNITLGKGVKSIGERAFDECTSLTTVYYGGTVEQWNDISIESDNTYLTNATRYYYSESMPNPFEANKYWHWVNGTPTIWTR